LIFQYVRRGQCTCKVTPDIKPNLGKNSPILGIKLQKLVCSRCDEKMFDIQWTVLNCDSAIDDCTTVVDSIQAGDVDTHYLF
jgi:hypothetical protein